MSERAEERTQGEESERMEASSSTRNHVWRSKVPEFLRPEPFSHRDPFRERNPRWRQSTQTWPPFAVSAVDVAVVAGGCSRVRGIRHGREDRKLCHSVMADGIWSYLARASPREGRDNGRKSGEELTVMRWKRDAKIASRRDCRGQVGPRGRRRRRPRAFPSQLIRDLFRN